MARLIMNLLFLIPIGITAVFLVTDTQTAYFMATWLEINIAIVLVMWVCFFSSQGQLGKRARLKRFAIVLAVSAIGFLQVAVEVPRLRLVAAVMLLVAWAAVWIFLTVWTLLERRRVRHNQSSQPHST